MRMKWLVPMILLFSSWMLDATAVGDVVRQILSYPLLPVQRIGVDVTTHAFSPVEQWQTASQAQRRVQLLSQQLAELTSALEEMDQLKAENRMLRELLNASNSAEEKRTLAVPITAFGKPAIGIGKLQGVTEGNLLFINQVLIGRVTKVEAKQALVELLSSGNSQPILARTESGVEGLVKGDDRRVNLTEVPRNQQLQVGERVVTVGQLGIPAGLLIGQISSIESIGTSPAQTAVVDQLVSFFTERQVEVRQ